jgi:hypothetical protein
MRELVQIISKEGCPPLTAVEAEGSRAMLPAIARSMVRIASVVS